MDYIYFIGSGVVAVFWLFFYFLRKDLRKKILLTSIIGGALGISEIFFVPNYWNPQFKIIKVFDNLFLDSFVFAFFLTGFTSVIYQVIFKKPVFNAQKINPTLLFIAPFIFLFHLVISQINVMVFSFGSMLIAAFFFYLSDKSLGKPILLNGLFTFVFFLTAYIFFWHLFPSLGASYTYKNLTGVKIFRIPFEELFFFFAIGTNFCLTYEILSNSKFKKLFKRFYD